MKRAAANLVILLAYAAFLFVMSVRPMPEEVPSLWGVDKLYHAGAYGLMSVLIVRAAIALTEHRRSRVLAVDDDGTISGFSLTNVQLMALSAFIATAFGAAIEVVQSMGMFRYGSPYDALSNGIGALVASIIYVRLFRRRA